MAVQTCVPASDKSSRGARAWPVWREGGDATVLTFQDSRHRFSLRSSGFWPFFIFNFYKTRVVREYACTFKGQYDVAGVERVILPVATSIHDLNPDSLDDTK